MTITATAPVETATLAGFFQAYGISYIELLDEPGNGIELNPYAADDSFVILGFDEDDEDVKEGYHWDIYCPLILIELANKLERYHRAEGRLTLLSDGTTLFKGNVTFETEV